MQKPSSGNILRQKSNISKHFYNILATVDGSPDAKNKLRV